MNPSSRLCNVFVAVLVVLLPTAALATDVCGPITTDTTWTLADSPYIVTCDVVVQNDATLAVEAGVEVRFEAGTKLWIGSAGLGGGALIADGLASPILFTSNAAGPSPGDWKGIEFLATAVDATFAGDTYVSGSILRNVTVEYGEVGVATNAAPALISSTFRHNAGLGGIRVNGNNPLMRIQGCLVEDNVGPVCGSAAAGGITAFRDVLISGCTIRGNTGPAGGLYMQFQVTVQDSEITANVSNCSLGAGGVVVDGSSDVQIVRSCITDNLRGPGFAGGILFQGQPGSPLIVETSLVGNEAYDFYNRGFETYSFPELWWGTPDPAAVAARIYDCQDDPTRGCLTVEPVATTTQVMGMCELPVATAATTWGALKGRYRD